VVLAYIIAILMALDARKTRSVSKNYYKDGTSFDRISMFKEGQSLLKQSFITVWQLLEIIQYINIKASVPIPNWRLNVQ